MHNFMMAVRCCQMQRRVVTSVRGVNAGTSLHKHLDDFQVAFLGRPVQRAKPVVIAKDQRIRQSCNKFIQWTLLCTGSGRWEKIEANAFGTVKSRYSPLIHIVFGVVEPDPNLHSNAFTAPLKMSSISAASARAASERK
jgi:hypothetical protein